MVDIARFNTLSLLCRRKKIQKNYSGQSQYEDFSQFSEPIKLQSKFVKPARRPGKCVQTSDDWLGQI